jgi:hypothetical protein
MQTIHLEKPLHVNEEIFPLMESDKEIQTIQKAKKKG